MRDVLAALNGTLGHDKPVVPPSVVDMVGASPAQDSFALLVRPDGGAVGNVGRGGLEQRVREEAADSAAIECPCPRRHRISSSSRRLTGLPCCSSPRSAEWQGANHRSTLLHCESR
ncbi:XdhC family protein [Chloroflexota bacterium]